MHTEWELSGKLGQRRISDVPKILDDSDAEVIRLTKKKKDLLEFAGSISRETAEAILSARAELNEKIRRQLG
ncbi:hypothetical protein [Archaeoglobus sp.]